jgi:phage FluMu gp28-like protein
LYSIAYPGITWGGRLEIFSTPRGTNNYFQTLINEILHGGNPKGFSFHKVTLQDALDQGFLYKLQSKLPQDDARQQMDETDYYNFIRAGCPDEETFMQEYMCVPADDYSAFLPYDLIASCEYAADIKWESLRNGDPTAQLYIGVDVARTQDLTVIWIMEKLGDVLYTRGVETMKGETFEAQENALYTLLRLPQVKRCCIDQTGIGRQFAERAQRRFGEYRVEGVNFTSASKEELAYPVRAAFEAKRLRIPSDPKIRSDLRAIKKELTTSGNVRFVAERGPDGHADRFWALALAVHAGARPPGRGPSAYVA